MVDSSGTKESQLCIVSLIGKSALFEQQCNKSWKFNQLIQMPAFKQHADKNEDDFEIYYDHLNNTIYVHLRSFHDTYQLLDLLNQINDNNQNELNRQNFAQLWETKQANFIKKSLVCFLLSHIIIISHSSHTFDLNYIRFLRIIELLRQKSKPALIECVRALNLPRGGDGLINDGRICVPRALFIFENHHHKGGEMPGADDDQKLMAMAHQLEDIIYHAMRSSYIISNQSNASLFTIAHKQPFVFVHRCYKESSSLGQTQKLLGILQGFVKQTKESSSNSNLLTRSASFQQDDAFAFKRFLFRHIEQALTDGWSNDGISGGARSEISPFELCTYPMWIRIFHSIRELYETIPTTNKTMRQAFGMLRAHIDPDGKLSETRCRKCLPMAIKYYEDGLPSRYTRLFHERRLQATIEYFATYARGPSYKRYVQQLIEQCTQLWRDGRQLCEAISLTGNPCKNELHRVLGDEDASDLGHLSVRAHNSKIQLMAASNCGQILQEREDPFDLKEANFDFYQDVNKMLTVKPIYFEFPVFRGTIASAEARSGNKEKSELLLSNLAMAVDLSGAAELSQSKSVALYSPVPDDKHETLDNDHGDEETKIAVPIPTLATCNENEQPIPSTTEYLDGMTHSDSPPGLLPRFSSWSLCCIGRASDYSSNKGLQQPGFLSNLNHLIPWDINPHNKQTSTGNAAGGGGGAAQYHQQRPTNTRGYRNNRRGNTATSSSSIWDVTVRVYIGCEYECPRGHRFICSTPNHVVRVGPNGSVKDDGAKLVRSDMPLYTPCSCRNPATGGRVWSQLMRAYVVTPSSSTPIQCVLHPQVVPAGPNNPTFFPSYAQPIHLTDDSIWVLRFPFIYHGDETPFYRPQNDEDIGQCLILRDLFSWSDKT